MAERLSQEASVGSIVASHPEAAYVFRKHGIDFCCHGKQPLGEACGEKSLDPNEVLREISASLAEEKPGVATRTDWTQAPLMELCGHIIATHHAYLRTELPRLSQLLDKIHDVHGDVHPELAPLRDLFVALYGELEEHMLKEEGVLSPPITRLETARGLGQPRPLSHCGSVGNPIAQIEYEHEQAGGALQQMSGLTAGYSVPDDACPTFRETYEALDRLEGDLFQHIHLENNILHPRAVQLEASF